MHQIAMAENSHIQWTTHTFNPWIGCSKVSPGCAHCYAETLDRNRYSKTLDGGSKEAPVSHWGPGAPRHRTSDSNWKQPLKWNRQAAEKCCGHCEYDEADGSLIEQCEKCRVRPRVFCASLADWLDDEAPIEWLADLLKLIHDTPNLDWLNLTKRPENFFPRLRLAEEKIRKLHLNRKDLEALATWIADWINGSPPSNVWIGTTVEDQLRAEERIPELLKIPACVRFLSCEPLLTPLNLDRVMDDELGAEWNTLEMGINWVICGGESGKGARKFNPEWARSLRDQCQCDGVAFFMKQFGSNPIGHSKGDLFEMTDRAGGSINEFPEDLRIRQFPGDSACAKSVEPPARADAKESSDGKSGGEL